MAAAAAAAAPPLTAAAMDPSWPQPYSDPAGASRRHNGGPQILRDYAPAPAAPVYPYDHAQYHGGASIHGPVHRTANPAASPPMVVASSTIRDGNGDIPMDDAHDTHAGIKYPLRPHHQSHMSGGRPASLHSAQEQPSSAAQRYSPMDTLSPTSPYAPKSSQFAHPPSQTQSPAGQADYPQSPYFTGRPSAQHLPPISPFASSQDGYSSSAVSNLDGSLASNPKSPQRQNPTPLKPVPEFKKVRAMSDLHPKISRQPPFRRANPEGGFISVCVSRLHHVSARAS